MPSGKRFLALSSHSMEAVMQMSMVSCKVFESATDALNSFAEARTKLYISFHGPVQRLHCSEGSCLS